QCTDFVRCKSGASCCDQFRGSNRVVAHSIVAEVNFVAPGPDSYAALLAADFPWARIIPAPDIRKVPALRRRGVEEATGEYVAIVEEHCSAKDDWLATALAAHARGRYAAVGGPIADFDYDNVPDWVGYFLEYNSA